jgi:acid stress chaperone HdeB
MRDPITRLASAFGLIMIAAVSQPAHAQVMLDLSKVTCEQWSGYKITNPQNIALWLSGYYNGKRSNTVIDTQGLAAENQKLRDFCITNPKMPVMQAAEKLMGSAK